MPEKPDGSLDGVGEDDDYRPDPSALRISAVVIRRRADQPGLDPQAVTDLIDYASDYWEFAALIDGRRPARRLEPAPASAPAEIFLTTETLTGSMESRRMPSIDVEIKTFSLAATSHPDAPVATVDLIQHANGAWEVLHAEVEPGRRRQRLATTLYDRIEEVLGVEIRPSGWLSEDAYAFWRRRNADSVAGYRQVEPLLQLWISPKQLLNLMTIDRTKIEAWMQSAADDAPQRLH